jgi:hypothetical protein
LLIKARDQDEEEQQQRVQGEEQPVREEEAQDQVL